jgi:hypothetical protein
MWPFAQRKRNRVRAQSDQTSLGNLLLEVGQITPEQLVDALRFQDENPDVMLGDALVRLDVVERGVVEQLLIMQRAKRSGRRQMAEVIELATATTRKLASAHVELRTAALRLNGKPAKVGS